MLDAAATLDAYFAVAASTPTPHRELQQLLQTIADYRAILPRPERHIAFFGSFKTGKSTLINALLGAEIVPTRVLRATGVVTCMGYAQHASASLLHRIPGNGLREEPIAFDELASAILLDLHGHGANRPAVEYVQVRLPVPLLQGGWVLVDTPGLVDDPLLSQRTYAELARSDVAVLVLSAYQLLSIKEREAARIAQTWLGGNIVFVVNQMDLVAVDEQAEVLERARLILQGAGNQLVGQPRIFATNALHTHDGITPSESVLIGVPALAQWLTTLEASPLQAQLVLQARLSTLEQHLARLHTWLLPRRNTARQIRQQHQQHHDAERARQRTRMREAAHEDCIRLGILRQRSAQLSDDFVRSCTASIAQRMAADPAWPDRLKHDFCQSMQLYLQQVRRGTWAALTRTRYQPPLFELRLPRTLNEMAAAEGWVEGLGFWVGFLPGIADEPAPAAPPLPGLDLLGEWFDLGVAQVKQQILLSVEQTARHLGPLLQHEAEQYFARLERMVVNFAEAYEPELAESPDLHQARSEEATYDRLLAWCEAFAAAIDLVQQRH
ncbi:MAG: hypothetical protein HC837_01390 [Chloroflexaceae bacterium]|nr:hypothetical protein [Chloroflexaceae bacterium]